MNVSSIKFSLPKATIVPLRTSQQNRNAQNNISYLSQPTKLKYPYAFNIYPINFCGTRGLEKGYIQIYTGNGKGKTTTSMGLALRALGQDKKVAITMFTKGGDNYGEIKAFNSLKPELRENLVIDQAGFDKVLFTANKTADDEKTIKEGWERAKKRILDHEADVVILDEINIALDMKILDINDVINTLKNKPKNVEVVLTGRNAKPELVDLADLVSNIQPVKHYFDKGVIAREGIEY